MKSKNGIIIILAVVIVALIAGIGIGYVKMTAEPKEPKAYAYNTGDYFVTNVLDSRSLIKTGIVIVTIDEKTYEFFEQNQYKVRDTIINILRNKTFNEMTSGDIQSVLKQEIKVELESKFSLQGISDVYFNEFVVQQ